MKTVELSPQEAAAFVAKMTGWQNHQWMRAGCPRTGAALRGFLARKHSSQRRGPKLRARR